MGELNQLGDVYDIILSSPGIDDEVKLGSKITCRSALFIVMAVDFCMGSVDKTNPLKGVLSEKDQELLTAFVTELLQLSRLQDFYGKLKKHAAGAK